MISSSNPQHELTVPYGISAISTYRPPWQLSNEWYEEIPRKFVKHTGIESRPVALEDEITLAERATRNLVRDTRCDLNRCAAVVFTSPSFVPMKWVREQGSNQSPRDEQMNRAAWRFVERMELNPRRVQATNTFCAGYARALAIVRQKIMPTVQLQQDEFVLVITSSRISRITDYGCRETGALFGDFATATMISREDNEQHPVHFELLDAHIERVPTNRPFFRFSRRQQVLTPTAEGGRQRVSDRVVFSLDGMGIADIAPRAMAHSASEMAHDNGFDPSEVQHIIPHQAGFAIVRLAEMKLRDAGFTGTVVNGMTTDVGNVSSGSIPYTLHELWDELSGNILCPVASVSAPERCAVAQGCIALRSTAVHDQDFSVASETAETVS